MNSPAGQAHQTIVLKEGRFMRLVQKDCWEYVERVNCSGIVIILAVTAKGKVIFTEQFRMPVGAKVIEYPAGLVADSPCKKGESIFSAAKRELLEETGYCAEKVLPVTSGPAASGSASDILTFVRAVNIRKVACGGGDETESIVVHEIPLGKVEPWLLKKKKSGCLVDPKVYAGLYFLRKYNKNPRVKNFKPKNIRPNKE